MSTSRVTRFLTAGTVAVSLGAGVLHAGAGHVGAGHVGAPGRPGAATKVTKVAFFEQQSSVKQTATTIEFTSLLFVGDARHHARSWTATDHYLCTFAADGPPICDGEIALGDSMLLIHGTGGQGTFSIPVVGGTGRDAGARGVETVHDLAHSADSNLVVTLTRR